jgi:hypothetical protein
VLIRGGPLEGHHTPERPGPPAPAVQPEVEHENHTPTPVSSSTETTETSKPTGAAKPDAAPAGSRSVDFTTYAPSTGTDGSLINIGVPDISGADSPDGLAVHTGNLYVDVVDGGNVTRVNPTTMFTEPLAGGLCCDQVVTYVPSIERFVWLMQHCPSDGCFKGATGSGGFRIAVASAADVHTNIQTAWTYFDFTGATFGRPGAQFDYPDLAYTDHFLVGAINIGNDAMNMTYGRLVFRLDLAQLSAGGSVNYDYIDPSELPMDPYQYSHLAQHSGDMALLAGNLNTATIRVLALPDGGTSYAFHNVKVAKWLGGTLSSIGQDGNDWLNPWAGTDISAAARTGNQLWLAWTANAGTATSGGFTFPRPYVRVAAIEVTTWKKKSEMQVWNPDYAFAYPALETNANGEVGIIVGWGGPNNHANTAEGIIGDYVVWYHVDSNATPQRFGDYITIRRSGGTGSKFAAFGYYTTGTVPGGFAFTPYYSVFSH